MKDGGRCYGGCGYEESPRHLLNGAYELAHARGRIGPMRAVACLLVAGFIVGASAEGALGRERCVPCGFAGTCDGDETCGPTAAGCRPRDGILVFNSVSPPYAYWTLFAKRRSGNRRGRLGGKLKVFVDKGVPTGGVPGFPARRCRGSVCFGDNARLKGAIDGDQLAAKARYPGGEVCLFHVSLMRGLGTTTLPNHHICRDAAGSLLSEGPLDLQGIRLFGCRQ